MKTLFTILILLSLLTPPWAQVNAGSDLEKEQRWKAQISDSLMSGDLVELKAADLAFTGIFTEASDGPTGRAALLVHGIGAHPDWPDVIYPLRSELPEHGWSTLSIQMPILANDAEVKDYLPLFDEVAPRMNSAIAWLKAQGNDTVVIVAHSLGASMAARYLADTPQAGVGGLVAIGMSVIELDDKMNGALALEKITLPVLDLYGSRDLDQVVASAETRARAARKAPNPDFRQITVEGADHFFVGVEDELIRRVYGWLKTGFEKPDGK